MLLPYDVSPGYFYEVRPGAFFIANTHVQAEEELYLQEILDLNSSILFSLEDVYSNSTSVGTLLSSTYEVTNLGAVLIAHNSAGTDGESGDLVIRSQDLVIYNYGTERTIAINPRLNSNLQMLLEDQ